MVRDVMRGWERLGFNAEGAEEQRVETNVGVNLKVYSCA